MVFLGPGGATAQNQETAGHHGLLWPAIAHGPAPAQATVPSGGRAAVAPAAAFKARRVKLCLEVLFLVLSISKMNC